MLPENPAQLLQTLNAMAIMVQMPIFLAKLGLYGGVPAWQEESISIVIGNVEAATLFGARAAVRINQVRQGRTMFLDFLTYQRLKIPSVLKL